MALLDAIRSDLTDYGRPGAHLHGPRAISTIRLAGGRVIEPASPAAGAVGGAGATPVNWVAMAGVTVSPRRTTAVSVPFTGLAMITYVSLHQDWVPTGQGGGALLVSDDDSGAGQNLADMTPPSGVSILAPSAIQDPQGPNQDEIDGTFPINQIGITQRFLAEYHLRYAIRLPRFFLKLTNRPAVSTGENCRVFVAMLTNLSARELDAFL